MELLVIKAGDSYIRVITDGYELVSLKKASVFSLTDEAKVLELCDKIRVGLDNVTIKKLVITEEDYYM